MDDSDIINASGADDLNKLTSAVDKLAASLSGLGASDSALSSLSSQMQSLQQTMVMGFTEMAALATKASRASVDAVIKAGDDAAAAQTAAGQKILAANARTWQQIQSGSAASVTTAFNQLAQGIPVEAVTARLGDLATATAASMNGQLEQLKQFQANSKSLYDTYYSALADATEAELGQAYSMNADFDAKRLAAQAATADKLLEQEIAAENARAQALQAGLEKQEVYIAESNAKKLAAEQAALDKQRALNASFVNAPLSSQIKTAATASTYAQSGGDAATKYGSAAASADVGALTAQQTALAESAKLAAAAEKAMAESMLLVPPAAAAAAAGAEAEILSTTELSGAFKGAAHEMGIFGLVHGQLAAMLTGAAIAATLHGIATAGAEVQYQLQFLTALSSDMKPIDLDKFIGISEGSLVPLKDAAAGMHALAEAGFNSEQALTALPDILRLSALGEMSVAEAAQMAVESMHAFGMESTDLGRITDVLTAVAASANVSTKTLSEGLKSAATTAQSFGLTFEETTATVAELAKRGLTIQPLATALTNLYEPSKKVAEAMALNGITTKDASGQLLSYNQVLAELAAKLNSVNDAPALEKSLGLNSRSAKAVEALRDQTGYQEELTAATNATGFALQATATLADTAQGQFTELSNTLHGQFVKAFDEASPAIEQVERDLRGVAGSQDTLDTFATLATAATRLTELFVTHLQVIAEVAAAYAALKIIASITASLNAYAVAQEVATARTAAATIAIEAEALALGATAEQATLSAARVAAVGAAGTLAGGGLTVAATGAELLSAAFGPIVLVLGLATAAYEIYNAAQDHGNDLNQKTINSADALIDSLQGEIDKQNQLTLAIDLTNAAKGKTVTATETTLAQMKASAQSLEQEISLQKDLARQQGVQLGTNDTIGQATDAGIVSAKNAPALAAHQQLLQNIKDEESELDKLKVKIGEVQDKRNEAATATANATNAKNLSDLKSRIAGLSDAAGLGVGGSPSTGQAALAPEIQAIQQLTVDTSTYAGVLLTVNNEYTKIKAAGNPVKSVDKAGDSDRLNALIAELALNKELAQVEQKKIDIEAKAANQAGTLGDIGLIQEQAKAQADVVAQTIAQAKADIGVVQGSDNKRAATQKYLNAASVGQAQLAAINEETQAKIDANLAQQNTKNLQVEAANYNKRGDLLNGFLTQYEADNAKTISKTQADLAATQAQIQNAAGSDITALTAQATTLQTTLDNLKQSKTDGTNGAIFQQTQVQFDQLMADIKVQLDNAKAKGEESGGGLSGALGVATTAANIQAVLLPQLTALGGQLQSIAKDSGQPSLLKAATDDAAKLGEQTKALAKDTAPYGQAWDEIWKHVNTSAEAAFDSFGKSGTNSIKQIGEAIKTSILDMLYQLTVKQWLIQVGASITGSVSGSGVAGAASALGASSSTAGAISSASSLISAANTASSIYGALTSTGSGSVGAWLSGASSVSPYAQASANLSGMTGGDSLGTLIQSQGWSTGADAVGGEAAAGSVGTLGGGAAAEGAIGTAGLDAAGDTVIVYAGTDAAAGAGAGAAIGADSLGGAAAAGGADAAAADASTLGPYGWVAAAAILIGSFLMGGNDKVQNTGLTFSDDNNPGDISINGRGNQGQTGTAYLNSAVGSPGANGAGITSSLGTFGVSASYWSPADSTAVTSLMTNVATADDAISALLTTGEKTGVQSALKGHVYTTASLGAEGTDQNAAGQLDAVFKDHIDTILEAIQPGLSKLEAGFVGTQDQLTTEVEQLLKFRTALQTSSTAVFGAQVTLEDLAALKEPTEATSAALTRVTAEFTDTNAVATSLGQNAATAFGAVGLASEATRAQLVTLSGGLDQLNTNTTYYMQNFLSASQQLQPVVTAVDAAMASLGETGITTKEQFTQLVNSLDLSKASDQQLYVSLMQLAPAFLQAYGSSQELTDQLSVQAQIYQLTGNAAGAASVLEQQHQLALEGLSPAMADLTKELWAAQAATAATAAASDVSNKQDALVSAYQSQAQALQSVIDTAAQFAKSMTDLKQSLQQGDLSTLSPLEKLQAAQQNYQQLLAAAKSGDTVAQGEVGQAAQDYLTADKAYNASNPQYAADATKVQSDLQSLADSSVASASVAQQQLTALTAQVTGLVTINTSLEDGFQKVQEAIQALATSLASAASLGVGTNSGSQSQSAVNGVVNSLYQTYLGRAPDATGGANLAAWISQGGSIPDAIKGITTSKEYADDQVEALYKSLLGRAPAQAGLDFWAQAIENGTSVSDVAAGIKSSPEYQNLPAHAAGGYQGVGMAITSEEGPEAIDFKTPGRVYTADQTAGMFAPRPDSNPEVIDLLSKIHASSMADKVQRAAMAQAMAQQNEAMAQALNKLTRATREKVGTR